MSRRARATSSRDATQTAPGEKGGRLLTFPLQASAPPAVETTGSREHLTEDEQVSALHIAGYVGRLLAARGPLRPA